MKIIYISGKYSGNNRQEVDDNIKKSEFVAKSLIWKFGKKHGLFTLIPHKNTAHFEDVDHVLGVDYDYWIAGSLELLRRSDCVYMMSGWKDSKGAIQEHNTARILDIPIFYEGYKNTDDSIRHFLEEDSNEI